MDKNYLKNIKITNYLEITRDIEPDQLLIYKIKNDTLIITLVDTDAHSDFSF